MTKIEKEREREEKIARKFKICFVILPVYISHLFPYCFFQPMRVDVESVAVGPVPDLVKAVVVIP